MRRIPLAGALRRATLKLVEVAFERKVALVRRGLLPPGVQCQNVGLECDLVNDLMILEIFRLEPVISPMATTISSRAWLVSRNLSSECATIPAAFREFSVLRAFSPFR
jgi:hypothetical protein